MDKTDIPFWVRKTTWESKWQEDVKKEWSRFMLAPYVVHSVHSINLSVCMGQEVTKSVTSFCPKQKVTSMFNGVLLSLSGWKSLWE